MPCLQSVHFDFNLLSNHLNFTIIVNKEMGVVTRNGCGVEGVPEIKLATMASSCTC